MTTFLVAISFTMALILACKGREPIELEDAESGLSSQNEPVPTKRGHAVDSANAHTDESEPASTIETNEPAFVDALLCRIDPSLCNQGIAPATCSVELGEQQESAAGANECLARVALYRKLCDQGLDPDQLEEVSCERH